MASDSHREMQEQLASVIETFRSGLKAVAVKTVGLVMMERPTPTYREHYDGERKTETRFSVRKGPLRFGRAMVAGVCTGSASGSGNRSPMILRFANPARGGRESGFWRPQRKASRSVFSSRPLCANGCFGERGLVSGGIQRSRNVTDSSHTSRYCPGFREPALAEDGRRREIRPPCGIGRFD